MDSEISFPRGGITRKAAGFSPVVENIFSSPKPKKQKSKESRKRKRSESSSETQQHVNLLPTAANILTYEQVQEGMLLLGCIRTITSFSLEVELPGKMCGRIQISNISDQYTQFLQQKVAQKDIGEERDLARLKNFFYVGQFVPTKVIEKSRTAKGTKLSLSLNPTDIYLDWNHRILQRGLLIWAAVESELDHGYQLDVGISNCRMFLPHDNVPQETTFVIGQPLWCTVQKCSINVAASTVTVSVLKNHLEAGMQNIQINLHHLVPGMQFDLNITKAVKNGLQGNFLNNCTGYVNEAYLAKSDNISNYSKGQTVAAYLMYVHPTTKFCCFSLRNIKDIPQPQYTIGTITKSKIISRTGNGIIISLSNGENGFVSFKRILREMSNKKNLNEAIAKKYAVNSSHQCRILDYRRFEQIYICSFEQTLLKEKIFRIEDAKLGQLVNVKVKSITKEGLLVQLGNINAFIHNSHLSSVAFSENIKTKFKTGQNLQARIWSIDDRGVYLTHKQAFVDSDVCLTKIEDTILNKQYPGFVAKNCSGGVLVVFYGGIRGWLSSMHLNEFYGDTPPDMFYEGQVVTTTIKKIRKDNVLDLVLDLPKPSKRKAFRVGEYVDGIVSRISKKGLELKVGNSNIKGFLPVNHLSSSLSLTSLLLHTYAIGDILKDLLCISDRGVPILSLREAVEYKKRNLKVSKMEDLAEGDLVRCSYESSYDSGIYVSIPFKPASRKLKISTEQLVTDSESVPEFQPQQAIVAKVVAVDPKNKMFKITARLGVSSWDYEGSAEYLQQYLLDIKQIQLHLRKQDSPLGKLQIGQHVQCTVTNTTDFGYGVRLEDDVQGFVPKQYCAKHMKRGKKLAGIILWMNYKDKYAVVAVAENILKKIDSVESSQVDTPLTTSVRGEVLLVLDDCVISVTQSKQLVFLPAKMHINAFIDKIGYKEGQKIKLIIVRKVDDKIIAIDRQLKHKLKKKKLAEIDIGHVSKKRKLDNKINLNNRAHLEQNSRQDLIESAQDTSSDEESYGLNEEENSDGSDDVDVMEEGDDEDEEEDDDEDKYKKEDGDEDKEEQDNEVKDDDEVENQNSESENEMQSDFEEDIDVEDSSLGSVNQNETSDEEKDEPKSKQNNKIHNSISTNGFEPASSVKQEKPKEKQMKTNVVAALPGVQNFFNNVDDAGSKKVCLEDSSDDEIAQKQINARKKKLSSAERKALAREEEERLRKKEIEIANCAEEPQNEEEFRMLLTGKPNASELWAKYIAYCISNAEIHKARNIARTALEKIDLQETEERYNIWIILLNLENSYGDKNSFNQVFEEAVRCNDDLRIYLDVINILADTQKYVEMEEKVKKAKSKYKHESKMWLDIVRTYYKIDQCKEARNLQNAALKSVDKKTKHIDMIVQFAIMEFQYGDNNHAEALFESILQSAPQRVDVWSTYTDQMVKKGNIDGARRTFERGITQSIPVKKMKTLFKKFKDFEVKYGSQERVNYVIELARKYVGLS